MPDGEEPVVETTLESLHANVKAQSTLLRELATAFAQLTARERVVGGEGAHGSGYSGQRIASQPTGSGGAAVRPDLLELAQSGRVGAKSVSDEDDYLAVQELLERAESGYEAVRPLQGAGVDEDVAVDTGEAAKVSTSDGEARLSSELLEPCEATFRLRKGAASAANAIGVPLSHIRYQGGWATNSDVVLDYIDPNVLPLPGAWFFFGHIAPLRHFQVEHDSAAVAFPLPTS
eukprot:jgi/Tetstr1/462665/TSEL_000693.t1